MYRSLFAAPVFVMAALGGGESMPDRAVNVECRQDRSATIITLVEEGRLLEDGEVFKSVNDRMTLRALVAKLGPASRDVGSGLHILIWETRDGSTLRARSSGMCDPLMSFEYAGNHPGR